VIEQSPIPLYLVREQPSVVRRLDRQRELVRVRAGVYVRAAEWMPLPPWTRYLVRVHAVARTWSAPTFCLESAAALRGLPVFGEPLDVHLLGAGVHAGREGDVVVHASRQPRAVQVFEGLGVTSVVDTALDLCRVLPPAFALAVADATVRTTGALLDFGALGRSQVSRRGVRQLDWVGDRATTRAESVGESVSRAVIEWLGYEHPELQVEFSAEGFTDRVDFFWRSGRVIGESDGYGKYDASDVEASRAKLIAEKRREDRLRRQVKGFGRWDWADTMRVAPLDRKLAGAGLRRVRPVQAAMLATVGTNARSLPASRITGSAANPGTMPGISTRIR
jgi:hypothetical protein